MLIGTEFGTIFPFSVYRMCYIIISSCLNHVAKHLCAGWTFPQKDNSQIFYAGEYDLIKTTNIDQCLSINSFLVTKTLDRQHTSLSMRGKHVTCACNKRHYTVSNTSSENKVVHYDLLRVNTPGLTPEKIYLFSAD